MENRVDKLCPASQKLLRAWPVRKTKAQKAAFRAELLQTLEAAGWPVKVESGGSLLPSHNLVAGKVDSAKLILTAHYDTPARLPFPNFIAPRNLAVSLLYQVLLAVLLCLPVFLAGFGAALLFRSPVASMLASLLVLVALLWLLLAGPANPSNVNDNTSGTLTLLELAHSLPVALRGQVALVFFDNEEKGLLGSMAFAAAHKKVVKETLALNFDCVGEGDTLLFVRQKACRRDPALEERLAGAFLATGQKQVLIDSSPLTLYPSDQLAFKRGIGVAACRTKRGVGLYLSRLHTSRDTVLDQDNLVLLCQGVARLAQQLAGGPSAP